MRFPAVILLSFAFGLILSQSTSENRTVVSEIKTSKVAIRQKKFISSLSTIVRWINNKNTVNKQDKK